MLSVLEKSVVIGHSCAFLVMCTVIDALTRGPRGCVIADEVRGATLAHHRALYIMYAEGAVVPKFHYAVLLPTFL